MLSIRAWKRSVDILVASAVMALIAACSSAGSQQPALPLIPLSPRAQVGVQGLHQSLTVQQSSNRADVPQTIYIADALRNAIDLFRPSDGKFAGSISDDVSSPWGLFVDGKDSLWVVNSDYVSVYPRGQKTPNRTLQDPNERSEDVCVAKDGTVYVSNFTDSASGPGSVSVYAPGHNWPTMILHDPQAQYLVGVASDSSGNVFATINDSTGVGYIDEFVGGKQSGFKRLPPRFSYASDIKIDSAGNLLILDGTQLTVSEYTKSGRSTGVSVFTVYQWYAFDVSRGGTYIAGTESLPDQDRGILEGFPSGKRLFYMNQNFGGGIAGVAIAPGRFN